MANFEKVHAINIADDLSSAIIMFDRRYSHEAMKNLTSEAMAVMGVSECVIKYISHTETVYVTDFKFQTNETCQTPE